MPTLISNAAIALGVILLIHACYSAWEHSSIAAGSLQSRKFASPAIIARHQSSATTTTTAGVADDDRLPLDISLEAISSVFLICVGLVLGAEELKPIGWGAWAGNIERESGGGGPYQGLEERIGFMNIRKKRQEFSEWVRAPDKGKDQ